MGDGHDHLELLNELTTPVVDGGCAFCGVTELEFAIDGVTHQWPRGSHLRYCIGFDDLGAIPAADVRKIFAAAFKEISDCCNATFELVTAQHQANLLIVLQRLDGRSGVLGDCGIPVGSVGPDTQLRMRLDTGERWGWSENPTGDMIDAYRVILHELLHFMGLGHKPASIRDPALISPTYSPTMGHLQPADKVELVRRMGLPKVSQVPPPPTGSPRIVATEIKVTIDGVTWTASGPMKRA